MKSPFHDTGGELAMITTWAARSGPLILRTDCRVPIGAGRTLRDGMTAQRAAALGPEPVWTSGLVAA
ncbi:MULTISPECIES: hypothetical protein [unclassified Amycolatopsis]|uniref:hypothetical protein n=1 Tax=unclassified Amycolatopsis TaxID=2618356 RepID=UPI001FF1095D|nr:hypothetical protein [Amycolatopsis sp. FBCC-B4732]UOX88502.1 hypothetical protein MUY14_43670 [Amycolatopsis sp. FBCC-B4732]